MLGCGQVKDDLALVVEWGFVVLLFVHLAGKFVLPRHQQAEAAVALLFVLHRLVRQNLVRLILALVRRRHLPAVVSMQLSVTQPPKQQAISAFVQAVAASVGGL
jgi:hypothetical protein